MMQRILKKMCLLFQDKNIAIQKYILDEVFSFLINFHKLEKEENSILNKETFYWIEPEYTHALLRHLLAYMMNYLKKRKMKIYTPSSLL